MSRGVWLLVGSLLGLAITASAQFQNDQLVVRATQGRVAYSLDHVTWKLLAPGMALGPGAALRTEAGSTADVILKNCRTALRLAPDSELEVAKLSAAVVGDEVIADTVLNLKAGSVTGSQRKLARLSRFDILFPGGAVTIHGTEYNVKASGTVACITGVVSVQANAAKVLVPAGTALDSATGTVSPASPQLLAAVQPEIAAVRVSAQAFATPLVAVSDTSNGNTSPNHGVGNGNGNGNDHQNGNGGGNGNGNANGNGNGDGSGPGTGNGQK